MHVQGYSPESAGLYAEGRRSHEPLQADDQSLDRAECVTERRGSGGGGGVAQLAGSGGWEDSERARIRMVWTRAARSWGLQW